VPTYQYACTQCGHAFEQVQSFSDETLTVCPECQGRLRKVFNAVGVVFKGSGFYRNDSRGSQTSSETPAATAGSSSTAGDSSSTSASGSTSASSGSSESSSSGSSSSSSSSGDSSSTSTKSPQKTAT
jgi:putative FmdB family regulatory protein